jgi:hypothetical protein
MPKNIFGKTIGKKIIMLENPLSKLAFLYGSDKCPEIKHNYTPFYYEFLKDKKIKKIFEIGVGDAEEMAWAQVPNYQTGASLKMWRDFFPEALVYGMDIKPNCVFEEGRIKTFLGDHNRRGDLENIVSQVGSDIDLFIEDGSHRPDDQVFVCRTLMPLLKRDVIYVIEDVGHPEITERLSEYDCFIPNFKRCRRDDRLIVVRNKNA